MLDIKLFGIGHAQYCEWVLVGFLGQQSYYMLCYLLLNRHRQHDRDKLAAVFWSDYTTCLSRKHLRNTLGKLRTTLVSVGVTVEQYLSLDKNTVGFLRGGQYQLDTEIFEVTVRSILNVPAHLLTDTQAANLGSGIILIDALDIVSDEEQAQHQFMVKIAIGKRQRFSVEPCENNWTTSSGA